MSELWTQSGRLPGLMSVNHGRDAAVSIRPGHTAAISVPFRNDEEPAARAQNRSEGMEHPDGPEVVAVHDGIHLRLR
jgi:hypothetical protein